MTQEAALNPLKVALAINGDTRFTASESRALVKAVQHTDNATCQVRNSQRAIAESIGVSEDTVGRAFKKALALAYFVRKQQRRNAKGHLVTDYWFAASPPTFPQEEDRAMAEMPDPQPCGLEPDPQATPQEKEPSHSFDISTPDREWIEANAPAFDSQPAPERVGSTTPVFHVTDHQRPQSKAPEWKQRQYFEKELAEEGFDPSGEWIGRTGSKPGRFRGRRS